MTRSEPSSPAERLAALRGESPTAAGEGGPAVPGGVWPPPRTADGAAEQGRGDPPTVPLSLPGASESAPSAPAGRGAAVLRRLVPAGWRGARVDPGRPGATALALVAAGAAVVAAVGVWIERPRAEPVNALPAVTVTTEQAPPPADGAVVAPPDGPAATVAASGQPAVPLVVSVSGKVERPGLVEVPPGARVADVLEAAGGALPGTDLSAINLARRVADGEQVAVGVPPAADSAPAGTGPPGTGGAAADGPRSPVDLNVAGTEQLEALPGVGPVMAGRILEWRAQNGRFVRVEQLREIEGIGERRFAQLRELVKV